MSKKLRARSQFYPDLELLPVELQIHSQLGDGYNLAELGNVDELYDRLAKYDREDLPLDLSKAELAISYFMDDIPQCGTISFKEAFDQIDKTKSIGFGATSKKIFCRADPNMETYMKDYLRITLEQSHHVIINASQKDEVRVAGKTPRLFTAYPPEHTLMCVMLLGDFMRHFTKHRFCTTGSANTVGDAMQLGAGAVYKKAFQKHPYYYCTDTSAQDSSVHPDFIRMVYEAIAKKYEFTEDEAKMFDAIANNSINKVINVNGDLYYVPRGLGSGDYLTIVINVIWRMFLFLDSYNHDLGKVFDDNTLVICGDDFAQSSAHDDLNHDSVHAKIEWAGKHIPKEEMDFCSVKFYPFVHHDPIKIMAVLNLRKKHAHSLTPRMEMQRLGGILRVLSTEDIYDEVIRRMKKLLEKYPELEDTYSSALVTYEEVFTNYNSLIHFHKNDAIELHGVLKPYEGLNKMSQRTFTKRNGKKPNKPKQPKNHNKPSRGGLKMKKSKPRGGFGGRPTRDVPFRSVTGNQNISNRKMDRTTVTFNEALPVITSSIQFLTTKYSWNPGQSEVFPWLSKQAAQWEKYRFKSCELIYVPQVTEFDVNGKGSLIIGFDSDASDPAPPNFVQAMDMQPRSVSMPCKQILMTIPEKIMNTLSDGHFIRKGSLPRNTDIKTYDCGNLFVSTIGQHDLGSVIGFLTVKYTIELLIPVLDNVDAPVENTNVTTFFIDNYECPPINFVTPPYGISPTTGNPLGFVFVYDSVHSEYYVQPKKGIYLVNWNSNCYDGNTSQNGLAGYTIFLKVYTESTDTWDFWEGFSAASFEDDVSDDGVGRISLATTYTIITDGTKKFRFYHQGLLTTAEVLDTVHLWAGLTF